MGGVDIPGEEEASPDHGAYPTPVKIMAHPTVVAL
jgi:hypothetical protein